MAGPIKKIFQSTIIILALALSAGYLYYLYPPLRDGELKYFIHLPFALLALPVFLASHFRDLLWTSLIALSGIGISFLILEKGLKARLPVGFLLGAGLGILGLVIFWLGALHLLFPNLIRFLVALPALPGIYFCVSRGRKRKNLSQGLALEAVLILAFSIALILVLAHPTTFYDTLSYHFALPRQYLLRNSAAPIPTITYSYFPQIAEMLYLTGLAVSGQVTAQMINLLFWLAIILLGREVFGILFGPDKKILGTIILISLPIFGYLTHLITNDIIAAFFVLAGVYLLIRDDLGERRRAFLFGLIAGLGCGIKLTLYIYLLLPQALWLAYLLVKADRKKFISNGSIAALGFVIICGSFWIRNIVTVGNPLFPALANVLGGPLTPEQSQAIWDDAVGVKYSIGLLKELFRIPHGFKYVPIYRAGQTHPVPFFGTAFIAGLILLLLKRPDKKLLQVWLYCLVFYLCWTFSFRLTRFAIGLWIILAILSAGGFSLLLEKGKRLKRMTQSALTLAILMGLILELLVGVRDNGWKILLTRESAEEYLYRLSPAYSVDLGAYPIFNWLNHNSRPEDRVLLVGTTSFFYLERKATASSFIDWNPLILRFNDDQPAKGICRELNQQQIRYLVFQPEELDRLSRQYPANRLTPKGRARMNEFFQSPCLEPVAGSDFQRVYLYRIKKMGLP